MEYPVVIIANENCSEIHQIITCEQAYGEENCIFLEFECIPTEIIKFVSNPKVEYFDNCEILAVLGLENKYRIVIDDDFSNLKDIYELKEFKFSCEKGSVGQFTLIFNKINN